MFQKCSLKLTSPCLAEPAPAPHCVITNHHALYKDPETGLPFFNSYAYKKIHSLRRGEYKWSALLGSWVGTGTVAARGVPAGFLGGAPEEETAKEGAAPDKSGATEPAAPVAPAAAAGPSQAGEKAEGGAAGTKEGVKPVEAATAPVAAASG